MIGSIGIEYSTLMGFKLNGTAIPDPSSYDYSSQSLDTSAERDLTGLLHRNMVTTKYNVSVKWDALDYYTAKSIVRMVHAPSFTLRFPCPELDADDGHYTGTYYCGDRKLGFIKATDTDDDKWIVSMSFDMIEY